MHWPSAINIAARILQMCSGLLSVYVFSRLFDINDFSLWNWLFSIFVIITSQDFGLLSAMRVWLGKEYAQQQLIKQQTIFMAGIMGMAVILTLLIVFMGIYWLVQVDPLPEKTVLVAWVIFASTFSILGTVCANALLAMLNSGAVGAIEFARSLAQLIVIGLIYFLDLDIISSALLYYLLLILYVPAIAIIFLYLHRWSPIQLWGLITTKFSEIFTTMGSLIRNGTLLWVNQLAFVLILAPDIFYAGLLLSNDDVSTVTILNKLVGLSVGIFSAGLLPYFGLYIHRMTKEDNSWIFGDVKKAFLIIILIGLSYMAGLLLFGEVFVFYWSGFTLDSPILYGLAGCQAIILCLAVYMQLFFQGPRTNFQILPIVLAACAIRLLFLWLGSESLGMYSIFISSILAYLTLIILMIFKLRSLLRQNTKWELMW
ncbi:lipopolysaccharide biosynthesis protein [Polynucleobacter sp. UB-Piko-W3]|uniref:lipopolysaccharide biosynthesis protein n=1 Tax=Polynucleobacter sp. UB-Piko-W3 TaxID=1819735 RepID=UPI001C0DD1C6|nr:hypothetical protein [Polynucleobacter sp. UB-Piko-W3]MBU3555946.1 hypothetical protein [Polynucleobacter sp. UB-Piko-W3]